MKKAILRIAQGILISAIMIPCVDAMATEIDESRKDWETLQKVKNESVSVSSDSKGSSGEPFVSGDYKYVLLDDGTVEIVAYTGNESVVTIPSELAEKPVTSIGSNVLEDAYNVSMVFCQDGITTIKDEAFGDSDISYIALPETLESIGDGAFEFCWNLSSIILPENVSYIGEEAFGNCRLLEKIEVMESNTTYTSSDGILYNKDMTELLCCPGGIKDTTITLPDGVLYLHDYAFSGCDNIFEIQIPKSVENIEPTTFFLTTNLENIVVDSENSGYTSKDGILYNKNITKMIRVPEGKEQVEIPSTVKEIGDSACCNCDALKNIVLSVNVSSIDSGAFMLCDNLAQISILNKECEIFDSEYAIAESAVISGFEGSNAQKYAEKYNRIFVKYVCNNHDYSKVITEATCTSEGLITYTCNICGDVKTERIPQKEHIWDEGVITTQPTATTEGVKTYICTLCKTTKTETIVATGAPEKGTALTDTKTKARYIVTKSGEKNGTVEYSKSTDKNIKTVEIPATVEIEGITYKVTSIAANAFKNNTKITTVKIGSNITSIGTSAFSGCTKLKTVKLGKNLKTIGTSVFSGCKAMSSITLTENITSIGEKAFHKCTSLTKITIPSKVKKIGKQAFYGDKKLKTITIKTTKLTTKTVGSEAFKGTATNATIKVPKSKLSSYKKWLVSKGVNKKATIKK